MSDDNKSTGNLFVNDYKTAKNHPDFTGFLDITSTQIKELVEAGRAGEQVKLKLGMWRYPSKRDPNEDRFFLVAESGDKKGKKKTKSEWDDPEVPF